jgi:outer membrane lipoprotein-sorting protein
MRIRLGLFVVVTSLAAASAHAITVDELVAKNVAARGGMDNLQAIKTLRMEGKLIVDGGLEIAGTRIYKRPSNFRFEGTLQGMTMIQSYDGKGGWRIFPFQGRKDPERTAAEDLKELGEQADFDGSWVNAAAKGNKLEYLGTEDVDGTDAYKLKVTLANGDVEYVFFDSDQFLVIRSLQQRSVRGVEIQQEVEYSDYEKVNGAYFAFASASGPVGATQKDKFTIEKATANEPVDDSLFAFPAASGAGK